MAMERQQLVTAFTRFREVFEGLAPFSPAPYHWEGLAESMDMHWMAYHMKLKDYAINLANEINRLGRYLRHLEAWAQVLATYDEDERYELALEFVDPTAITVLNLPAVIKGRTIFFASHLCHQANRVNEDWQEDLEEDQKISLSTLSKRSTEWRAGALLIEKLGLIDDDDSRKAVRHFRNRFHHRDPPNIEIGFTAKVTKISAPPGRAMYAFGFEPPLLLAEIIAPLWLQHRLCLDAFRAFQRLVWEQLGAIERASNTMEPSESAPNRWSDDHFDV